MTSVFHQELTLSTPREDFVEITREVKQAVVESGVTNGLCTVFCAHTTAGITVNENADPTVVTDMLYALDLAYPQRKEYRHLEGNTPAHLKSSAMGCEQTFPIVDGALPLGIWQGIYFCEFDGPRTRKVIITIVGE